MNDELSSSHATTGAPFLPGGRAPVVASLLLFLLAVHSPEHLESVIRALIGTG